MRSFLSVIMGARVPSLMRLYEEAVHDVTGVRCFAYSRRAGPQANKNWKSWCGLAVVIDRLRVDAYEYLRASTVVWRRATQRRGSTQKWPTPAQLASPVYQQAFARQPAWRRPPGMWEQYKLELELGVDLLDVLRQSMTWDEILASAWTGLPSIILALCDFPAVVAGGRASSQLNPDHFQRVVSLRAALLREGRLPEFLLEYSRLAGLRWSH